jgi:outer membrane protein assembly factor BamB
MSSLPSLKRSLAAALAVGLVAAVLFVAGRNQPAVQSPADAGAPKGGKQDWTMFGGSPQRNMVNATVKGLPTEWSIEEDDTKNVKWVADLGSKAYGGPLVAAGRVVIGTNNQNPRDKKDIDPKTKKPIDLGVLMAFEEDGGKFLWQVTFHKLEAGRVVDWPLEGLCSTPVVDGDKLYYVSNRCALVATDLSTGKSKVLVDMIKELGVFPHNISACSPLLADGNLFLVTANGVDEDHINVPAPKAPSFIKVDKNTGKVLWQDNEPTVRLTLVPKKGNQGQQEAFFKNLVNRAELIQHGQWSNPAYAVVGGQPQVIFPGGDGWIRAFDPSDGKLIWKFDCNPKDAEYELSGRGTRSDFIATPVVYKDRVYIGVGQDPEHNPGVGHLWCIAMDKKGDVSPQLVTDNSVWPPKTEKNPNSAMVWHYGGPITDPAERKKLGRNHYFGRTMSTCAIHDGICYAAELLGFIHCLDAETGKVYWSHDTRAQVWSSPYYADGKVYLGNDDNTVFVFAHGKQKKILAQNTMEGRVRATPVAANGVLYVMTENKLYAIAEGATPKKK